MNPASVPSIWRAATPYLLMLAAAVVAVFIVRAYGEELSSRSALPGPTQERSEVARGRPDLPNVLLHVLVVLLAVIVTGRLLGAVLGRLGQPPVMGEVLAGICLGPSVLGRLWPAAAQALLPPSVGPVLGVIAQLGVIFYMFIVGLELNPARLRGREHTTVAISHASIVAPFVLGVVLALLLYPKLAPPHVPFTGFALFVGTAMSVTAFPVLARILADRGQTHTDMGVLALACAAADDVTAWCLLAFAVGAARSQMHSAALVIALAAAFVGFMFIVVRPLARRLTRRFAGDSIPRGATASVFVAVLAAALVTEAIGIHAAIGAFLVGFVVPHDSGVARAVSRKLGDVVGIILLPAYFAFTGMRTEVWLVSGLQNWLLCGLMILVATVGKFGGTFVAARLSGVDSRMAASLGVLMNTRGLMQLIVLNIGLDLGIITPTLYAMMVIMALVTTLATTPALHLLERGKAGKTTANVGVAAECANAAVT